MIALGCIRAVLVASVLLVGTAHLGWAQTDSLFTAQVDVGAGQDTLVARVVDGVQAYREEAYADAARALQPVVQARPGFWMEKTGMAAYWLGQAYLKSGDPARAHGAFQAGMNALREQGGFDLLLADAFVRSTFRHRVPPDYRFAATVYLTLLEQAHTAQSEEAEARMRAHFRQVASILPPSVQARTGIQVDAVTLEVDMDEMDPRAGEVIAAWWRSKDPLPATRQNERIHEHLRRAAHAVEHYTDDGGIDDRGKVYIRYGDPERDIELSLQDSNLIEMLRNNPTVDRYSIAENEFWTYKEVDREAQYLFVEKEGDPGYYKLSDPSDLFPRGWATGRQHRMYIYGLEAALRQLAVHHEEYAKSFSEIAFYSSMVQSGTLTPSMGSSRDVASRFRQQMEARSRQNAHQRAKKVPRDFTRTTTDVPSLAVSYRSARFLKPNGATRLDVYWTVPTRELLAPGVEDAEGPEARRPYVLVSTATREGPNHTDEEVHYRQYSVASGGPPGNILTPRTFTASGPDSLFHVAAQWDQFEAVPSGGGEAQLGSLIRRKVIRIDSVRALSNDTTELEMSDLKPLTVAGGSLQNFSPEDAIPYPFTNVTLAAPLALYFEVYHLAYDAEDRTQYTVEYEVIRRKERTGLGELFRDDEESRTAFESTYTGSERTADEYILIDLKEVDVEPGDDITVAVRVTDQVSGQQKTRLIQYRYPEP